jgi:tetratricopeptide (TPR) repeat protein
MTTLSTVFFALIVLPGVLAAQQPGPTKHSSRQVPRIDPTFKEASALLDEGRLEEAKLSAQQELEKNPASVDGYNLLGIILTTQKDYASALDAFERALKISPDSARTRNNIGNSYIAQGKSELAQQEFRKVLRVEPSNRDANYNLGLVLLAKHSPARQHGNKFQPHSSLPAGGSNS